MKRRTKIMKTIRVLLAFLLLSGCAAGEIIEKQEHVQEQAQEQAQEHTREQVSRQAPTFLVEQSSREDRAENGEDIWAQGSFDCVKVTGEDSEPLKGAVEAWSRDLYMSYEETYELFREWGKEQSENVEGIFRGYAVDYSMSCTRADTEVFSVLLYCYEFAGGAHGNYGYQAAVFDSATGALLRMEDVFADIDGFRQWAEEQGWKRMEQTYGEGLDPGAKETYAGALNGEPVWYLDGAGIHLIFNPYELGPYAMGAVDVTFSYEECGAWMKPEYNGAAGNGGAGSAKIPWDTEVKLPLGEGETLHTLKLWIDSDETKMGQVCLDLDGTTHSLEIGERGGSAYIVRMLNGKTCLLYDADPASDDFITYVYDLTGEVPVLADSEYMGILPGSVSAKGFQSSMRVDFLGTYGSIQTYEFAEDGSLQRISEGYPIRDPYGYGILTVKQPIPVVCNGEEKILPAGTRIRILETDLVGTARYRLEGSGEEGEISFQYTDESKTIVKIGDLVEYECFEDLPYAG